MKRGNSQGWLPSIFNDFFDSNWVVKANATAPAINVIEKEKEYKVEIAAPGMNKEDFHIQINKDNNLLITMEKKCKCCQSGNKEEEKKEEKECRYLRREFSYSKVQQTLVLPEDVEKDGIKAKMNDGVLTICLPKNEQEMKQENKRTIEIA